MDRKAEELFLSKIVDLERNRFELNEKINGRLFKRTTDEDSKRDLVSFVPVWKTAVQHSHGDRSDEAKESAVKTAGKINLFGLPKEQAEGLLKKRLDTLTVQFEKTTNTLSRRDYLKILNYMKTDINFSKKTIKLIAESDYSYHSVARSLRFSRLVVWHKNLEISSINEEVYNIALALGINDPTCYEFYELYNELVPLCTYFRNSEDTIMETKTHRRHFLSLEKFRRPL